MSYSSYTIPGPGSREHGGWRRDDPLHPPQGQQAANQVRGLGVAVVHLEGLEEEAVIVDGHRGATEGGVVEEGAYAVCSGG